MEKQDIMPEWEKELRAKLEAELPDDLYTIGVPPHLGYTGKLGYINYMVAIESKLRYDAIPVVNNGEGLFKQAEKHVEYKTFNKDTLMTILNDVFK